VQFDCGTRRVLYDVPRYGATRQIAEAADVNLPALKYYFGGKQGLDLACAQEIVGRYQQRMLPLVTAAHAALGAPI
jgi:AcrR family transcriptional regulator